MDVKKITINLLKFLLFLSVGITILYLVYQKQNAAYQAQCALDGIPLEECSLVNKVITDFRQASFLWIGIACFGFILSNVSRAIRWNMLLHSLGFQPRFINSFFSVMLSYFANLGLPRMGEVVRAGAIGRYEGIPVEKAMGTVVADRIIDMLSLVIVVGLAFLLEFDVLWKYLQENSKWAAERTNTGLPNYVWFILAGILAILVFLFIYRRRILQTRLGQKIIHILKGFLEGIKAVSKVKSPSLFILHTIFIWLMYFLMPYCFFYSFSPTAHLSLMAALLVLVFGAFGIIIPSPGGMGTYHWLVIQALAIYGINKVEAFSFANIAFFSIQLFCVTVFGVIALVILPAANRNYKPQKNFRSGSL